MAIIKYGEPKPVKKKGRKPIFDTKILSVAGKANKYLHETNATSKETIRRRALQLGFNVKTFSSAHGGWDIKIL
jgi:hypothetical protein